MTKATRKRGGQAAPLTIEERVRRFTESRRTPAQRRRLRHALNRERGVAARMTDPKDKVARFEKLLEITHGFLITYER